MGFAIKAMVTQKAILNVKELGGADGIRSYWERYFSGHDGIVSDLQWCLCNLNIVACIWCILYYR